MKRIFDEFMSGGPQTKLSIISDISTILGVSVATFVAGPFMSEFTGIDFDITDFLLSITFYFMCLYAAFSIMYANVKSSIKYVQEKQANYAVFNTLFLFFLVACSFVVFPHIKYYSGNLFNVSYLLPKPAAQAIISADEVTTTLEQEKLRVSARLTFNDNFNVKDYVALLYYKNHRGLFEIKKYGGAYSNDYEITINNNGSLTAPFSFSENNYPKDMYLVVYRESDWSLVDSLGTKPGYPSDLLQIPSSEIDEVEAFSVRVPPPEGS